MTMLEKTVEALRRCVPVDTFNAAMAEVEREGAATKSEHMTVENISLAMLTELGVPAHLKGHPYIITGLTVLYCDPDAINFVVKELYPIIAERHKTTPYRVERAIRHAIEVAWSRGDTEVLVKYFGHTVSMKSGRPTNSEFLAQLAIIIRQKMKEV